MGRDAIKLSGVLPSILFASSPTATTRLSSEEMATTVGSLATIPSSATQTRVFAVPKSIAILFLNINNISPLAPGASKSSLGSLYWEEESSTSPRHGEEKKTNLLYNIKL